MINHTVQTSYSQNSTIRMYGDGKEFRKIKKTTKANPCRYHGKKVTDPNFNRKNILESLDLMLRGRSAADFFHFCQYEIWTHGK